ncbi:3-oxoadipate enol-lactonase [Massilia putida]|uniref:3-oxoadipate enol-lactonase n=1 Tax=Massilia putida TaxID=1141883 RepID=UPI0009510560|nr:3-oxoadipate enol-lactonase [Massilia putida]
MSFVQVDDVRVHLRADGDPARPCIVLSNSLGTDLSMWDPQVAFLARDFHVLRYDTRGHGRSGRGTAPVTLERLGRDVVGLLDALAIPRAHFCGISMGGMIGQWLGIHRPQRLGKLVLANTSARIGTPEAWSARAAQVRADGMGGVADGAAARWFTPAFIAREPPRVARMIARLREQDREGYAACCAALADADLRGAAATIAAATLVIAGAHDPVTTVADGESLAATIRTAELAVVPASHISNVEADAPFTTHLLHFLAA